MGELSPSERKCYTIYKGLLGNNLPIFEEFQSEVAHNMLPRHSLNLVSCLKRPQRHRYQVGKFSLNCNIKKHTNQIQTQFMY